MLNVQPHQSSILHKFIVVFHLPPGECGGPGGEDGSDVTEMGGGEVGDDEVGGGGEDDGGEGAGEAK